MEEQEWLDVGVPFRTVALPPFSEPHLSRFCAPLSFSWNFETSMRRNLILSVDFDSSRRPLQHLRLFFLMLRAGKPLLLSKRKGSDPIQRLSAPMRQ